MVEITIEWQKMMKSKRKKAKKRNGTRIRETINEEKRNRRRNQNKRGKKGKVSREQERLAEKNEL